ncbi:MAG: hypothetical protein CVV12_03030 [Gammaproteobacteria bacterium HGW-Gammaproteobacteria-2]|nr:MAG: hypothetical protein CVV12_03030 [Gammaproteobacteria bacterium HGW-Gammaproteobacteria-2]
MLDFLGLTRKPILNPPKFWHRPASWRDYAVSAAQLLVLWSFAVAQPLYDLLSRNGTFFTAHNAGTGDLLLLAGVLSLILPAAVILPAGLLRAMSSQAGWIFHLTMVGALVALGVVAPIIRVLPEISTYLALAAAVFSGVAAATVFAVSKFLRRLVVVLLPAVLLFPLIFLFFSPISALLRTAAADGPNVGAIGRPVPIVVVVFDELSLLSLLDETGGLDANRFPELARLAATSWWFPFATATSDMTFRALPAIATGRYPVAGDEAIPTSSFYPDNVFTWLGPTLGTNVHEVITHLCPDTICDTDVVSVNDRLDNLWRIGRDISIVYLHMVTPPRQAHRLLPSIDAAWSGFGVGGVSEPDDLDSLISSVREQQQSERGNHFLEAIDHIPDEPALTFVHTLLPHIPWEHLASGRRYTFVARDLPQGVVDETWVPERPLVVVGYHRYLLQTAYVDSLIGEMIDRLVARRLFDDALVIVTADHGVSFRPGQPRRNLTQANIADIMRVPMLVKLPGQKVGRVSARRVSGVDIVPTIADVLKAKVTWAVDGSSMVAASFPRRESPRAGSGALDASALYEATLPSWLVTGLRAGVRADEMVNTGPRFAELAGTEVVAHWVNRDTGLTLRSNKVSLLQGVASDAPFLPLHLSGEILGSKPSSGPLTLGIAINGVIKLTVDTFPWNGNEHFFSVMLPEAAFKEDINRVEVFAVSGSAQETSLAAVRWEGARSFRLGVDSRGMETLVTSTGHSVSLSVRGPTVKYALDRTYVKEGIVGLVGWVGDIATGQPPETIVITLSGSSIAVGEPMIERAGVAQSFGKTLLMSGYSFEIPRVDLEKEINVDPTLSSLRFFVQFDDGRTVELEIPQARKTALAREIDSESLHN